MPVTSIVPADSRYIPLTQQKWCCVPTCIQMIMLRHGIPLLPAELLGYHLGLVVPEKSAQLFYAPRTGPAPPAGYGTQVYPSGIDPNVVFKQCAIPLVFSWRLASSFPSAETLLALLRQCWKDTDVLVCFDYPALFTDEQTAEHWGHVCLIDRILSDSQIRLIDPSSTSPKWRIVSIQQLFTALQVHGDSKSGGVWLINHE